MPQIPILNALQTFVSAARHLNFTRAAEELGVSPSAVSHQIRLLEAHLGIKLFVRGGRALRLSADGEFLFDRLGAQFEEISQVIELLRTRHSRTNLTIVLRPFFSSMWLAPRLQAFRDEYPKIDLKLIHMADHETVDLENNDVAIIWGKGDWKNLKVQKLIPGALTPILHRSLIKRHGFPQTPADLSQFTLLHEESMANWSIWFAQVGMPDLKSTSNQIIDDTNVRYQSMINCQGVMLGCPALLRQMLDSGELVRPFEQSLDQYSYYLAYAPGKPLRPRVRRFIDWILQQAAITETDPTGSAQ